MEHNRFVGIENAARIPSNDFEAQMNIRTMSKPGKKKSTNPLLNLFHKLGIVPDPKEQPEREDKET